MPSDIIQSRWLSDYICLYANTINSSRGGINSLRFIIDIAKFHSKKLFEDKDIVNRIKFHLMALWKTLSR